SGLNNDERSEDVMYMDVRAWDSRIEPEIKLMREKLGILTHARQISVHQSEFPDVIPKIPKLKNCRNKPCPCGSGKKYKRCCLNK
ncbi:MAG TPA: SEC-C metal-binding domain-containing protein, partial [Candidatus Angelobacter sp.]|nr:SEC-C metal-binding domain-containing protein [Candidatus Angelobacter sp.]